MFAHLGMGYERALTIFSPAGQLDQVLYALEAVQHSPTMVGVKLNTGVVLVADTQILPLEKSGFLQHVSKMNEKASYKQVEGMLNSLRKRRG